MKRFFAFFTAATMLLCISCSGNKEIPVECLRINESIPLSEGSKFALEIDHYIEFPTGGFDKKGLENIRKSIRYRCLGEEFTDYSGPVDSLAKRVRDFYAEDYARQNEEMLRELGMTEEEAFNLNWRNAVKAEFGHTYRNYIVYSVTEDYYTGGAHGIFYCRPLVIDLKDGSIVPYRTFTGGVSQSRLVELVNKHKFEFFKVDISDLDKERLFFVDVIEPSDDYIVDENGITFYYQPYDVAPYVVGIVSITIPWEELGQK